MSATDELRRMLDERGVRWTSKPTRPETTWAHDGWWYNAKFEPWSDSTFRVTVYDLTPEQAIAATLGGVGSEVGSKVGSEVCGAKLTAEQVRELIAPHLHARPTFDFGHHGAVWKADFQAIADELNATLGGGTCEMEYGGDVTLNTAKAMGVYFCSECGSPIYNDCMPHYCGYCGKAVKR